MSRSLNQRYWIAAVVLMVAGVVSAADAVDGLDKVSLPRVDLNDRSAHHVVVDREPGQYLGHPSTCLLEDGKTILCVYPKGHGRGAIVYKRSTDGGLTWSDRLPTPDNWATSKEVPTLHRVIDAQGNKRIIMWSGLYPARLAVSEDDGKRWSPLKPAGDWGGIVVMGFVEPLRTGKGHYLAMFHDDGRFIGETPRKDKVRTFTLYQTLSTDGGLTWTKPKAIWQGSDVHLCEPGCIRSPDGKQMAVLLRENARRKNSHIMFSDDQGKTWTKPRELPLALTGDRHTGKYGPDGRLFISYRVRSPQQKAAGRPFEGDWGGWVGTYDDLVKGGEGQYVVRIKDNTKSYDTTYPGVEVLPDGTFVTTTYGHWDKGEQPYIRCARFKLSDLDALAGIGKTSPLHSASGSVISTGDNGRDVRSTSEQFTSDKPNFVIIMADDLGYGDLSAYGGWIEVPAIDKLAAEGMRFTDYHSNGPVCSPTRAALLTGRYQQRANIPGVVYADPKRAEHVHGLQHVEFTFAEGLKAAGYATGIMGKWHLGYYKTYNPMHHGFDQFIGYVSGNVDYFSHVDQAGAFDWWHGLELSEEKGYVTHLINQHAVAFIEKHKDRPFCLYVPHEAPHYPFQGPGDQAFRVAGKAKVGHPMSKDETKRAYRQMVEEMDKGVGQIIARLRQHGLDKKTLVIFCSDNGATGTGSNQPLRGYKGQLFEGGHRVPMVAWWPGRIEAGTVNHTLCLSMDLMPTILSLAHALPPTDRPPDRPMDGMNLTAALMGNKHITDRKVFWQFNNATAMRDGPWKLIVLGQQAQLYNLADDLAEQKDLSSDQPQRVKQMTDAIERWTTQVQSTATPQPSEPPEE